MEYLFCLFCFVFVFYWFWLAAANMQCSRIRPSSRTFRSGRRKIPTRGRFAQWRHTRNRSSEYRVNGRFFSAKDCSVCKLPQKCSSVSRAKSSNPSQPLSMENFEVYQPGSPSAQWWRTHTRRCDYRVNSRLCFGQRLFCLQAAATMQQCV